MRLLLALSPLLLLATTVTAANMTTDNVRDMDATAAATSTSCEMAQGSTSCMPAMADMTMAGASAGEVRVDWAMVVVGAVVGALMGV
jgi:hypothetical protein